MPDDADRFLRDAAHRRTAAEPGAHQPEALDFDALADELLGEGLLAGERLDDAFPLGDGTADDAGFVHCPYCGEPAEVALDAGGGAVQRYIEDCPVCCRPWELTVRYDASGAATVDCTASDPE